MRSDYPLNLLGYMALDRHAKQGNTPSRHPDVAAHPSAILDELKL